MEKNIDVTKLYETGNKKFFAAEINEDGTFGEKEYHEGLMEVSIEFSQEITELGADDDPAFISLASPLIGEGTVKFAVLPYSIYKKFFDIEVDKNNVLVVKSNAKPKMVAFGYYSEVGDGSESMFTIYKANFQMPSLNSVSYDGQTIRDLTLNVKINPYTYKGSNDRITYSIINSRLNDAIWDSVQDKIYIPDSEVE